MGGTHTRHQKKYSPQQKMGSTMANKTSKAVLIGRILYFLCLIVATAVLGWGSYALLRNSEKGLVSRQFHAIARGSLNLMQENFARKRDAFRVTAGIFATSHPEASMWPDVNFPGFEQVGTDLVRAVDGCSMAFIPLVVPRQREEFEQYAYRTYRSLGYPPDIGVSSFGSGIWDVDPKLNTTDKRYYRDAELVEDVYAPILQHSQGPTQKFLLRDALTVPSHREVIESVLGCVEEVVGEGEKVECAGMLGTFVHPKFGPVSRTSEPIFASSDTTTVVGFINSLFAWEKIVDVVDNSMNGFVISLTSTVGDAWTWKVVDGEVVLQGDGDQWIPKTATFEETLLLNPQLYSNSSAVYTISIYSSEEFCSIYLTWIPIIGMIGSVCIILLTSLFFASYDCFVRREFGAKKQLLDAKREFMRFISHEVRTPLNSVSMGLTLLQEEIRERQEHAPTTEFSPELDLCKQIQCNTQSAVDVLNDLLNYDKVECGKLSLEMDVVDIWDLIENTISEFELPAKLKEIDYIVEAPCKNAEILQKKVVGDPIRIIQVVRNLVSNAIKFCNKEGKITIKVVASKPTLGLGKEKSFTLHNGEQVAFARNGNIELSVTDTGAGMTEAQLKKLFRSGVQFNVNKLQNGKGSGLGLYIAKGIMEQHGGTLAVHSDGLECGTTFTVSLPLYHVPFDDLIMSEIETCSNLSTERTAGRSAEEHEEQLAEKGAAKGESAEESKLRILAVDDTTSNLKLLMRLISKRGHLVDGAEDGLAAVEKVEKAMEDGSAYDVICMDYQMPVMDGPAATKAIRDLGCDSFIVGITGNVLPEDVAHFKACGANDVLPKPFRVDDMEALWMENHVVNNKFDDAHHKISLEMLTDDKGMDMDLKLDVEKGKRSKRSWLRQKPSGGRSFSNVTHGTPGTGATSICESTL